jgi:cysteine desulfurase
MKNIYLDYQSTTPCDPAVVEAMLPFFSEHFGNPHSRNHTWGWTAEEATEKARAQVADLIGAEPKDVIFTSGATESNNLALKGVMQFARESRNHLVTCVTEHKCVLDTARHLEQEGFQVTWLPVEPSGLLDLDKLASALHDRTALVSVMAVNNETGVIQPLEAIGRLCRERGVLFHTDAAQAVGKIPVDVNTMNIDLLSLSGHKIYGPKGIGALYVRRKPRRVRLVPLINGGGQERGMRSGTLPTPLCVGLGKACVLAKELMPEEAGRLLRLREHFCDRIFRELEAVYLNGDRKQRVPGNLNISFACVEGEGLMMGISRLGVSSGSACTSASLEPSYVLRAMGVDEELAHTSLRISFGRWTTEDEANEAATLIVDQVNRLRAMSPLWDMVQEGIDLKTIQWAAH